MSEKKAYTSDPSSNEFKNALLNSKDIGFN